VLVSRGSLARAVTGTVGAELGAFMAPYATGRLDVSPEGVAEAAVALCSGLLDAMKWQVITVDRGTTFSDGLMRLYMAHEANWEATS